MSRYLLFVWFVNFSYGDQPQSLLCSLGLLEFTPELLSSPEGPISITLEDISFITNCSPVDEPLRLHEVAGEFHELRITQTLAQYASLKTSRLEYQEEFDFYVEWLAKYIFYSRGKHATGDMVTLSKHLSNRSATCVLSLSFEFVIQKFSRGCLSQISVSGSAKRRFCIVVI